MQTETDEQGAVDELDAPATEQASDPKQPSSEAWRVDKTRSLCRGRESLLFFLRPHHPHYRSVDLLPELTAGANALRESEEMAALNLVRERHAAVVAEAKELAAKHFDAMLAIGDGAADPHGDVGKLHRAAEKLLRELEQKENLVEVLAEEWRGRKHDCELKAKEIEAGFHAISQQGFEEIARIREEISLAISPLLDRWSLVMETISRNSRTIPERDKIIGPSPPEPAKYRPEEQSLWTGVPTFVPSNR